MEVNEKFKLYKKLNELTKNSHIGSDFIYMIKLEDMKKELIDEIEKGCGKAVGITGDCWHIRPNGSTPAYCSTCARRLKYLRSP